MRLVHLLKVSRLEGLADGIFAIAMTILVLDLRIPATLITGDLMFILEDTIFYKLLIYMGSFVILGTLWVAMNFQYGLLDRINRPYLWTNVLYLMAVCVVPFSASLVGSFPSSKVSISFYAINLLCANIMQLIIFTYAHFGKLNTNLYTPAIGRAIIRRILVAPVCYILCLIMAHWNTHAAFVLLLIPTIIYIFPGVIDQYETVPDDK